MTSSNHSSPIGKVAREKILARLKQQENEADQLGSVATSATPAPSFMDENAPKLTVPHTIRQTDVLRRFKEKAEASSADVITLSNRRQLTETIKQLSQNIKGPISMGTNEKLVALFEKIGLEVSHQYREKHQAMGFSIATVGIAETGTLLLLPSPENPTEINYLAEHHCIILKASNIVAYFEDAWGKLRKMGKLNGNIPPVINWVTGPSRTADIEQTIQMGAHGPRQVTILLEEYA